MRNLIGGVAAILIGAGYLTMALRLRESALADAVGPAGFPKLLAGSMMVLGIILCVQSLLAKRARRASAPVAAGGQIPEDEDLDADARRSGWIGTRRAAGMLALGIAYLIIVPYLGYVPSIALLIVAAALYQGAAWSWRLPAVAAAGAVVYWLVFVQLLGIPLPAGLIAGYF
jgi:hypothetical protein